MVALAELAPALAGVGPAPARGTTPQAASSGRAAPAAAIPAMNVRLVTMSFFSLRRPPTGACQPAREVRSTRTGEKLGSPLETSRRFPPHWRLIRFGGST